MATYLDSLLAGEPETDPQPPPPAKRAKVDIDSLGAVYIQPPQFSSPPGMCEVCRSVAFRYVCPRCAKRTCSVACCQMHRKESGCDGRKQPTDNLKVAEMNDASMKRDYNFLEKVSRSVEAAARTRCQDSRRKNRARHRLAQAIEHRGSRLRLCPSGLSLAQKNTTQLRKNDQLFWRVEWLFEDSGVMCVDSKLLETSVLRDALRRFASEEWKGLQPGDIEAYRNCPVDQWRVLLKNHDEPVEEFFLLDLDLSLRDNFRDKTILEFPSLVVKVVADDDVRGRTVVPGKRRPLLELGDSREEIAVCL